MGAVPCPRPDRQTAAGHAAHGWPVVIVVVLALCAAPSGQAQYGGDPKMRLEFPSHDDPMAPGRESVTLIGSANYTCSNEDVNLSNRSHAYFRVASTARYARAVVNPERSVAEIQSDRCTDPGYWERIPITLIVAVGRDAPAYERFVTRVEFRLEGTGSYGPVAHNVTLTVGYTLDFTVKAATAYTTPGTTFEVPITITNLANGRTKFAASIYTNETDVEFGSVSDFGLPPSALGLAASQAIIPMEGKVVGPAPRASYRAILNVSGRSTDARNPGVQFREVELRIEVQATNESPGPSNAALVIAFLGLACTGFRRERAGHRR